MPRINCTFREFIRIIEINGFVLIPSRSGTSHRQYGHADGRRVTVAYHSINDVPAPEMQVCLL